MKLFNFSASGNSQPVFICTNLTIRTLEQGVKYNFEHFVLALLLLTLDMQLPAGLPLITKIFASVLSKTEDCLLFRKTLIKHFAAINPH